MGEFVPYVGQDPPPWKPDPTKSNLTRWPSWLFNSKRKLRRLVLHLEETVAWERWKYEKLIHDYKLNDGDVDG